MNMRKIYLIAGVFIALSIAGCKKNYLETKPSNGVTEQEIFSKLGSVYAAIDGVVKEQFAFGIGASEGHDNFGQKAYDLQ